MAKILRCSDLNPHCAAILRAETEDELLRKAALHALTEHGMTQIPPEVLECIKGAIRQEC